jgi:hypothetical protein
VPDPHRMSCCQHDRHGRPHYLCRRSRGKIRRPRCNEGRDSVQGFLVAPHLANLDKLDKSIDGLDRINSPLKCDLIDKSTAEKQWARGDSNARPPRCEGSFSKLESLRSFFTTDCQPVKEIQTCNDKGSNGDLCTSCTEDLGSF